MTIHLNARLGGSPKIDNPVQQLLIVLLKNIKAAFSKVKLSPAVNELDFYLMVNGKIVKYYPKSGIYSIRHTAAKKTVAADICLTEKEWANNDEENKEIFLNRFKTFLLETGTLIQNNLKKKKFDFDLEKYNKAIEQTFEKMT